MSNIDLLRQYVDTGACIPKEQFDKLNNNLKKTYIRKRNIALENNNMEYFDFMEYEVPYFSHKAKISLLKIDGHNIHYFKNPTEEEQKIAVYNNPYSIQYIENPSEEVKLAAVKNNGSLIRYIENPSEELQRIAIDKIWNNIQFIKNPSEAIQLYSIRLSRGLSLDYLEHYSNVFVPERVYIEAINQSASNYSLIRNPSENVKIATVEKNFHFIRHIVNPSEEVQLAAVKQDPRAINYIKNPSDSVMDYVNTKKGINQNIKRIKNLLK